MQCSLNLINKNLFNTEPIGTTGNENLIKNRFSSQTEPYNEVSHSMKLLLIQQTKQNWIKPSTKYFCFEKKNNGELTFFDQ